MFTVLLVPAPAAVVAAGGRKMQHVMYRYGRQALGRPTKKGVPVLQVGIVPRDLDRSLRFYRDFLGLPYAGSRPALEGRVLHLFECDGGVLKLLELPAGAEGPDEDSPPGPYHHATGFRWVTWNVDDVDEAVRRCGDAPLQLPVTEVRPGLRVVILEDPDGNAVELVERR
jgi:catechol 2,3-dioxygenase-like lactoylglutathione lyase family enzyme